MQLPSLIDLQNALNFVNADVPRDDWVLVLMGIKNEFGDAGYDIADQWSQTAGAGSYNSKDFKSTWSSIKGSGGTTIATVFKLAIDSGYKPDKAELSPAEKANREQQKAERALARAKQEEEEQAERKQWHGVIAEFSSNLVEHFTKPVASNLYLTNKKVASFGLYSFKMAVIAVFNPNFTTDVISGGPNIKGFFDTLPPSDKREFSFLHIKRGDLVVPLIDINKKLWNLQIITASGTKLFLKHGRKSGCFHFIGKASNSDVIAVAEGYATGASIHMATKWPCAVALDAGNLVSVATQLKAKLKNKRFVICADDDANTKGNPGITKANEAAEAVGGLVAVPNFSSIVDKAA